MAKFRYSTIIRKVLLYVKDCIYVLPFGDNNLIYQTYSIFHFHRSILCNSFLFFFVCNSNMDFYCNYYHYYNLDLKRYSCTKSNITAILFNLIKAHIQYTKIYVEHGHGDL